MASGTTAGRQQNVFLNLVGVYSGDLKPEDRKCVICEGTLRSVLSYCYSYEEPEPPVKIASCGHVFGVRCIYRWLMAHGNCPMCRGLLQPLVPRSQSATTASTNTSADDESYQIPDWIERTYTGGRIDDLAGNAASWGDTFRPIARTPSPPAPTPRETQTISRTPAWQENSFSNRTPIPGRSIREPVLRGYDIAPMALPIPSPTPSLIEVSTSGDRDKACAGKASDPTPTWENSFLSAIDTPGTRETQPFAPTLPDIPHMTRSLASQDSESSGRNPVLRRHTHITAPRRPARTPARNESSVLRDPISHAVNKALGQGPRWTPASIRRGTTATCAGEASLAMAQLSIEDDEGQDFDVEASATTRTRSLSGWE